MIDLHDAQVVVVEVDWGRGTVRLGFTRFGGDRVTVLAESFSRVVIPREQPWGPSSSVNTATLTDAGHAGVRLSVELQTGDVLEVTASRVSVLDDGGTQGPRGDRQPASGPGAGGRSS